MALITVIHMNRNILRSIRIIPMNLIMNVVHLDRNGAGCSAVKKEGGGKKRSKNRKKANAKIADQKIYSFTMTVPADVPTAGGHFNGPEVNVLRRTTITEGIIATGAVTSTGSRSMKTNPRRMNFTVPSAGYPCGIFQNTSDITVITVKNTNKTEF